MIIVRTMNVGMCNQLFTYAYARYLAERTGQEIYLDYSHITEADMKHKAGYEDALGHFSLLSVGILHSKEEYRTLTGKLGIRMERLITPMWMRKRYRVPYLIEQERTKGASLWKKGIGLNLIAEEIPEYFEESVASEIILYGYWQTSYYARKLQDILCSEIRQKSTIFATHKDMIEMLQGQNSVCVHIRRGDYVGNRMHEVCGREYYDKAMEYDRARIEDPVFYLFSDDREYVKSLYQGKREDVVVVDESLQDYEELILMSCCKHFILSNSSFSWWAQFLSGSRSVIAPDRWYGDAFKQSLLPEEWWVRLPADGIPKKGM